MAGVPVAMNKTQKRRRRRATRSALLTIAGLAVASTTSISDCNFVPTPGNHRLSLQLGSSSLLSASALAALQAPPAMAADDVATSPTAPVAAGLVLLVVAFGALLLGGDGTDQKVDDKKVVEEYFNGEGFNRWQKIYGETEDVNPVQMDIRVGHAKTVDKILSWLDGQVDGKVVCDAGCGTGNLSIPLASKGAIVKGSDISAAMVSEASQRAENALKGQSGVREMPTFWTSDLEKVDGSYDTVCCVDVLIHYPPDRLDAMIGHLAGLSKERLVLSFAPKTWYYTLLKRVGELFPGKSKTTRAYLHEEEVVEAALKRAGFDVTRREMTATSFYFSRLFEAKPAAAKVAA